MAIYTYDDATTLIVCDCDKPLFMHASVFETWLDANNAMHGIVGIHHSSATSSNHKDFLYSMTLNDGRTWSHWIHLEGSVPSATEESAFNIPGRWKSNELIPHRAVRNALDLLLRGYDVNSLVYTRK